METKKFKCELDCRNTASSIHHIKSSFRGKRDDSPENLIALCDMHHKRIHNHSTYDNRDDLLSITIKYAKDNNADISSNVS
jgi:hypothetical protein